MGQVADTHIIERSLQANSPAVVTSKLARFALLRQFARFGIVGVLNTCIDTGTLNLLLWRFPTHDANALLGYNTLAYLLGAVNSFMLNKYWTFQPRKAASDENLRFVGITVAGFFCNDSLIWLIGMGLHPFIANVFIWGNASKVCAALGTLMLSYLGMRLWVFRSVSQPKYQIDASLMPPATSAENLVSDQPENVSNETMTDPAERPASDYLTGSSLSVILPAHNEEAIIAHTITRSLQFLNRWVPDFEVIVVNDGSTDNTRLILEDVAMAHRHLRIIDHPVNQGYGAALVSGFEAATKDLIYFMDSDGQFDIRDLESFFPLIQNYHAVLGYRIDRQDTQMRKLNAWGWKMLIRVALGVRVRDIDCAFKLFRADFFQKHQLETRGAMINTEILYKWTRAGYTYTQMGVHHLPRKGGRATGDKPAVILRALKELAIYALKWRYEEAIRVRTKITVRL